MRVNLAYHFSRCRAVRAETRLPQPQRATPGILSIYQNGVRRLREKITDADARDNNALGLL